MNKVVALVKQYPLASFFILTYLLSWWAWPVYVANPNNFPLPLLPAGPMLAALVITAVIIPIIFAGSIFFAWLHQHTNGSVLIAIILHTSVNTMVGFFNPLFTGAYLERQTLLLAIVFVVTAVYALTLGLNGVVETAVWQSWFGGTETAWAIRFFGERLVVVVLALGVVAILLLSGHSRRDLFLVRGNWHAPTGFRLPGRAMLETKGITMPIFIHLFGDIVVYSLLAMTS